MLRATSSQVAFTVWASLGAILVLAPAMSVSAAEVEPYAYADAGYGVPDGSGGWDYVYNLDVGSSSVSADYATTTGQFGGSFGKADSPINEANPQIGSLRSWSKLVTTDVSTVNPRPERFYYGWSTIMVPFLITSDSIEEGTNVTFDLDAAFSGTFRVDEGDRDPWTLQAYAEGYIGVYDESALATYLAGGTPSPLPGSSMGGYAESRAGGFPGVPLHWEGGDWDDDEVKTWSFASDADGYYLIGTFEKELGFTGQVGEMYGLVLDLYTEAWTKEDTDDACLPRVETDFYNTATYEITWTDEVDLEIVPEPATLALLGLGGLVVAARRRRHG